MTNSDSAFLVILIYSGMFLFTAASYAIFVTYLILNRNNNFGDFAPKIEEYSAGGIHYTREVNNVTSHEKTFLFLEYGENPYEGRKHSIPEQLIKNGEKNKSDNETL